MRIKCKIQEMEVSFETIKEMERYERFQEITEINCSCNSITKIENLPISLQVLNCSCNSIIKIENLPISLQELDCSNNSITKIENLPISLQILTCFDNKITKIENLPISLRKLDCSENKITKIENLPYSLQKLYCYNNKITKLENLPNSLQKLYCKNNLITKIENNLPISLQELCCDDNLEISDDISINIKINGKYINSSYQKFIEGKIDEKTFIKNMKIPTRIIEKEEKCLICQEYKKCIHLSCHMEHCYCVKDFVNWYYKNNKKCCMCMEPFKEEECWFG
jgi:Leucine-rich repeat (LRR) protein